MLDPLELELEMVVSKLVLALESALWSSVGTVKFLTTELSLQHLQSLGWDCQTWTEFSAYMFVSRDEGEGLEVSFCQYHVRGKEGVGEIQVCFTVN